MPGCQDDVMLKQPYHWHQWLPSAADNAGFGHALLQQYPTSSTSSREMPRTTWHARQVARDNRHTSSNLLLQAVLRCSEPGNLCPCGPASQTTSSGAMVWSSFRKHQKIRQRSTKTVNSNGYTRPTSCCFDSTRLPKSVDDVPQSGA